MQVLAILLGAVGFALADLPNMGPCTVNVESDSSFDLDQWATEGSGTWSYKIVPNTNEFRPYEWMFISNYPIADSGVYQTQIFSQSTGKEPAIYNQLILFDTHNGLIEAKPIYGNSTAEYKLFFLSYDPGNYAYFYICSDDGTNNDVDYRFVLTHGKLTTAQKDKIKDLESDFEFKGNLRYLTDNH